MFIDMSCNGGVTLYRDSIAHNPKIYAEMIQPNFLQDDQHEQTAYEQFSLGYECPGLSRIEPVYRLVFTGRCRDQNRDSEN